MANNNNGEKKITNNGNLEVKETFKHSYVERMVVGEGGCLMRYSEWLEERRSR